MLGRRDGVLRQTGVFCCCALVAASGRALVLLRTHGGVLGAPRSFRRMRVLLRARGGVWASRLFLQSERVPAPASPLPRAGRAAGRAPAARCFCIFVSNHFCMFLFDTFIFWLFIHIVIVSFTCSVCLFYFCFCPREVHGGLVG